MLKCEQKKYDTHTCVVPSQFVREVTRLAGGDDNFFAAAVRSVSDRLEKFQAQLQSPPVENIYIATSRQAPTDLVIKLNGNAKDIAFAITMVLLFLY